MIKTNEWKEGRIKDGNIISNSREMVKKRRGPVYKHTYKKDWKNECTGNRKEKQFPLAIFTYCLQ